MRIQILTSCTGAKRFSPDGQLTRKDFKHLYDRPRFLSLETKLQAYQTPAAELYTGQQHLRLLKGISNFKETCPEAEINLWIVSAGYGLIPAYKPIVPYECTFQGMGVKELQSWSTFLKIPDAVRTFFLQNSDLTIVLLSESYLRALALDGNVYYASPTLFMLSKNTRKYVMGQGQYHRLTLQTADTRRFSCGFVGLKGEVARRLLDYLSRHKNLLQDAFFQENDNLLDILQTVGS